MNHSLVIAIVVTQHTCDLLREDTSVGDGMEELRTDSDNQLRALTKTRVTRGMKKISKVSMRSI